MKPLKGADVRRGAVVVVCLGVAATLGLLATGQLASGHGGKENAAAGSVRVHHLWGPAAGSHATRSATLKSNGVTWTGTTYQGSRGTCVEIAGSTSSSSGSVGACGVIAATSYGVGSLTLDGNYFRITYGRAPAAAAQVRVRLARGSVVPVASGFAGRGIWFAAFPATVGDPGDDVSDVDLLSGAGNVVARGAPPALSAYERAAQDGHPKR